MRQWLLLTALLAIFLLPVHAQQVPPPPTHAQMLQEALDREARCRQTLGWLGTDANGSQGAQIRLLQEDLSRVRRELEDAAQKANAFLKNIADQGKKADETPGTN